MSVLSQTSASQKSMVLSEQESEILGILMADGSLSRTESSVQIAITGNKIDDEHYLLGRVRTLFLRVFDLELTSRYRQNEIDAFFQTMSPSNPKHLERLRRIRHADFPIAAG